MRLFVPHNNQQWRKIGFATEIKNAVIEAEATIGPQCFIADSVVANPGHIWAHKYVPVIIVWMNSPCLFELQRNYRYRMR